VHSETHVITIFGTLSQKKFGKLKEGRIEPFNSQTIPGACEKFLIFPVFSYPSV
jgi:hypothetical protein